jgi:hypothetical protein
MTRSVTHAGDSADSTHCVPLAQPLRSVAGEAPDAERIARGIEYLQSAIDEDDELRPRFPGGIIAWPDDLRSVLHVIRTLQDQPDALGRITTVGRLQAGGGNRGLRFVWSKALGRMGVAEV